MHSIEVKKAKLTFLIFFLLLISGFSFSIIANENSSTKSVFLDSDQDELSDEEEKKYGTNPQNPDTDKDGYADGAEIKSGYDPLKPAPGDKLETPKTTKSKETSLSENSANMTNDISDEIARMVSEGGSEGVNINDINKLIEEKISTSISFSDLPAIDESSIKIKTQDYSGFGKEKQERMRKEDNEEYLSSVFYIITNNSPHSLDSKEAIEDFTNEIVKKIPSTISSPDSSGLGYFYDLAERGTIMLGKMNDLEVPQDMLDMHKKGLQLANYAISLKEKVKVDNTDPIASLVSFSEVENLMVLANEYIAETESKLEELGLTNFLLEEQQ